MNMLFTINNSPFFGQEGKLVTSRHIRDRLAAETEKNLALRVKDGETEDPDARLLAPPRRRVRERLRAGRGLLPPPRRARGGAAGSYPAATRGLRRGGVK